MTLFESTSEGITVTKVTIDLRQYAKDHTSQGGENGIVDKIFDTVGTHNRHCVEFGGFELRRFSNVFPLWSEQNWKGLLIEGDRHRYHELKSNYEDMLRREKVGELALENAFVEVDGSNSLDNILNRHDFPVDIDLMSIDVDGTDHAIWKSLRNYRPRVVIIEFNPTVPPHISMVGRKSGNHVGAGVLDMLHLGNDKGYDLVACTGVNAIFVLQEESGAFQHRNDLDVLFNGDHLTYAMSTFGGGLFLSRQPAYNLNPFTNEYRGIENEQSFYFLPSLGRLAWMAVREKVAAVVRQGRLTYR